MGVDDGLGRRALVDPEVEAGLRGRPGTVDDVSGEGDDGDVVGLGGLEPHPRTGDQDVVLRPHADVARTGQCDTVSGQFAAPFGHIGAQRVQAGDGCGVRARSAPNAPSRPASAMSTSASVIAAERNQLCRGCT